MSQRKTIIDVLDGLRLAVDASTEPSGYASFEGGEVEVTYSKQSPVPWLISCPNQPHEELRFEHMIEAAKALRSHFNVSEWQSANPALASGPQFSNQELLQIKLWAMEKEAVFPTSIELVSEQYEVLSILKKLKVYGI